MAGGTRGRYGSAGEPVQRDPRTRGAVLMPGGNAGREGPPAEMLDRFAAAPVARLARLSSDGPRIVPVTFAWHAGTAVGAVVGGAARHRLDPGGPGRRGGPGRAGRPLPRLSAGPAARTGDRHPAGALDLVVGELTRPRHREAFSAVRARERFSTERAETCPDPAGRSINTSRRFR